MSSSWGSQWGYEYGSGTAWSPNATADEMPEIPAGDLATIETAQERIWKQFDTTVTWPQLMAAYGLAFFDVETVTGQLESRRFVGAADGVWLDEIGYAVGLPRSGWSDDEDYRLAVIAEALSQISDGSAPELIDIATRLAPEGSTIEFDDVYPAAFTITIPGLDSLRFELIRTVMADMPSAGVAAWLISYDPDLTGGFDFEDDPIDTFAAFDWEDASVSPLSFWSFDGDIG